MISTFSKGIPVELSKHFLSTEFDCHCNFEDCEFTYIDSDLIDYLQSKRNQWNKPIHINSGYRCSAWNKRIGGKPGSFHQLGKAADIVVDGMESVAVQKDCEDADGLGYYLKFTHVDIRGYRARWKGS